MSNFYENLQARFAGKYIQVCGECFSVSTVKVKIWQIFVLYKATITRCDLSPRFFCIEATLLCEFESDKI